MCGRSFLDSEPDGPQKLRVILEELNRGPRDLVAQVALGEVFPSQMAPVILPKEGGGFTVKPLRWGFPGGGKGPVINSRGERRRSPHVPAGGLGRRCLVPASGFYSGGAASGPRPRKVRLPIKDPGPGELMYLAGLYGSFSGGFEGRARGLRHFDEPPTNRRPPTITACP